MDISQNAVRSKPFAKCRQPGLLENRLFPQLKNTPWQNKITIFGFHPMNKLKSACISIFIVSLPNNVFFTEKKRWNEFLLSKHKKGPWKTTLWWLWWFCCYNHNNNINKSYPFVYLLKCKAVNQIPHVVHIIFYKYVRIFTEWIIVGLT